MASQPRGVRPSQSNQSSGSPSTVRYWLLMIVGGAVCLLGVYWAFQSYSNAPTKFYFGIGAAILGGIAGLFGSYRLNTTKRR